MENCKNDVGSHIQIAFIVLSVLFCLKETNFKDKALQKIHSAYTLHKDKPQTVSLVEDKALVPHQKTNK